MDIAKTMLHFEVVHREPKISCVETQHLDKAYRRVRRRNENPLDFLGLTSAVEASLVDETVAFLRAHLREARARCLILSNEEMWQQAIIHAPEEMSVLTSTSINMSAPLFTRSSHPALRQTIFETQKSWGLCLQAAHKNVIQVRNALCRVRADKLWRKSGLKFGHVVDAFPELDTRWCYGPFM